MLQITTFSKLYLFLLSGEGTERPTLLGPLERGNLNYWTKNLGRWTKSKKSMIVIIIHHRQDPTASVV
jgi:hypothetical protein